MYKIHPSFNPSDDEDSHIWKYMNFTELISLLEESSLFFSRSDMLGDPFEGSLPTKNVDIQKVDKELPKDIIDSLPIINKNIRKFMYLNCWHLNEYESEAMWRLYSKSDEGIAIRTTFKRFCLSFERYEKDVHIGKVNYINFDRDLIRRDNLFYPFLHKRLSYQHENELRAAIMYIPPEMPKDFFDLRIETPKGLYIPVNLATLVESIWISPSSEEWLEILLKKILNRYRLEVNVEKSVLNKSPLF